MDVTDTMDELPPDQLKFRLKMPDVLHDLPDDIILLDLKWERQQGSGESASLDRIIEVIDPPRASGLPRLQRRRRDITLIAGGLPVANLNLRSFHFRSSGSRYKRSCMSG